MKDLTTYIFENSHFGNSEEINNVCQEFLKELNEINQKYISKFKEFINLKNQKRASHNKTLDTDYLPEPDNLFNIVQAGLTIAVNGAIMMDIEGHLVYDTMNNYKQSEGLKKTLQDLKEIKKRYSKKEKEIEQEKKEN